MGGEKVLLLLPVLKEPLRPRGSARPSVAPPCTRPSAPPPAGTSGSPGPAGSAVASALRPAEETLCRALFTLRNAHPVSGSPVRTLPGIGGNPFALDFSTAVQSTTPNSSGLPGPRVQSPEVVLGPFGLDRQCPETAAGPGAMCSPGAHTTPSLLSWLRVRCAAPAPVHLRRDRG